MTNSKNHLIPSGWTKTTLKEISIKMKAGGTPSTHAAKYYNDGGIPFVKIDDMTSSSKYLVKTNISITEEALNSCSAWIVPKNSILYSMYASYGIPIINSIEVATNQAIVAIVLSKDFVILDYVYYYLKLIKTQLKPRGTSQINLNTDIVKRTKILIPPLKEQKKIASILSEVDALIESTQKTIESTTKLKKGLMQRLLTRGIGHKKFKAKLFVGKHREIPESWKIIKLKNLCVRKPEYGANVAAIEKDGSLPRYIRITDITDDGLLKAEEWKSINEEDAKPYLLGDGDFLFARTGSVGRTYLYRKKDGRSAFAGYLIRFTLDNNIVDRQFLFYFTHSSEYWRWLKSIQTWGVQPNVNAKQYSSMPVLLPPIKEQKKIASILTEVDAYIEENRMYKEKLEALKKGLMQKLLTGKIRVKV